MITFFIVGLAAVAVGPVLTILLDRSPAASQGPGSTSAGMFVAVNDNAVASLRRAA